MPALHDPTLLSPSTWSRPPRSSVTTSKDPPAPGLPYRASLSALSSIVRDPFETLHDLRQGWDGLSKEDRAERVRRQARKQVLYLQLREATAYDEWRNAAVELDELEDNNTWKQTVDCPDYDPAEIHIRREQLEAARLSGDGRRMLFLIRTSLTRNLGNMGNLRLYSRSFVGTKDLIEQYINSALGTLTTLLEISEQGPADGLPPKMMLDQVLAARQAFGRSALLLSGGANFGMNHIGVLKALWEHKLLPRIISGASAGSIVCSVMCTHTDEEIPELLATFCRGNLAVFDEPGAEGSLLTKLVRFLKYGSLFDIGLLTNVVRELLGETTFQEAYNRTRRVLNIPVSSASLYELPRLLNYITAPNVLIWSAVAASCSVPLIFTSASLLAKDPATGAPVPWNASPQKWIDGSVDNDLPMTRLAEMFNVNHFIVSQVNPHVVPFIAKEEEAVLRQDPSVAGPSVAPSWLHTLTGLAKSEAIYRMHSLIDLGLFPNTLTKTVSVLSQKYSGDITILPEISYADFPTMMTNPTLEFMEKSMLRGERATWPKFSRIRNHLAIELALDNAVQRLRTRVVFSGSQADLRLGSYARSGRTKRPGTAQGRAHRRTSNSSELDPAAPPGRNRLSVDSSRSKKALSVQLPRGGAAALPIASTTAPAANARSPASLSDVLSSGAETSNIYTSDSLADPSSSPSSPLSPASGAEGTGDWDPARAAWSFSVPSTPAAHRRLGSYLALASGSKAGPAPRPPSAGASGVALAAAPAAPSAPETRYKKLFHGKGGAPAGPPGKIPRRPAGLAPAEGEEGRAKGGKRFGALGLEIDLSGTRGVVRKKGTREG